MKITADLEYAEGQPIALASTIKPLPIHGRAFEGHFLDEDLGRERPCVLLVLPALTPATRANLYHEIAAIFERVPDPNRV